MKKLSKDIENIIEESKYQTRLEIAEKCILQNSSLEFIMQVCSLTEEEIIVIHGDLKRSNIYIKELSARKMSVENNYQNEIPEEKQIKKHEVFRQIDRQSLKQTRLQKRESKLENKLKALRYREEREIEAELQRQIAAENTRILMKKIKEEQKNNRLSEIEHVDLREKLKEEEEKIKNRKIPSLKESKNKGVEKNTQKKESTTLSNEQKLVASIGKCYLQGFTIEQAILLSKTSREDVERIYRSFKR